MSNFSTKLGDICEIKRGTTITQKNAVEGNVPVVAGGINPTYFHNTANRVGKTISISGSGANAGYVNYWDIPIFASDCSTVQVLRDDISIKYIHYFLVSKQDYIYKELRSGAAQPHVYGKDIANIEINIPNLEVQNRIVAKLDAIFAEIDKATAAAEANAKNAEALFQSYLTQVFERGGEGWKNVYLHEVCDYEKNQGHYSGIPYIGLENIEARTTKLVSSQEQIEDVKSSTFKFTPEHLLYGRLRPYLNKVYLPTFEGHCSTEIFPIKPKNSLIREFLKYWFIQDKTVFNINSTCTGARMPRANMNAVLDFLFPLAPLATQRGIVDKLDALSIEVTESAKSYTNKVSELASLKQSILKQAFAGELVKD